MFSPLRLAPCLLLLAACKSQGPALSQPAQEVAGAPVMATAAGAGAPAAAAGSGGLASSQAGAGASAVAGTGAAGSSSGAGGAQAASGAGAQAPMQPVDAGVPVAGQTAMAGAAAPPSDAGPAPSLDEYAKDLNGLFIDAKCDAATPTPLAMMATCLHAMAMQRIEKQVTFGGTPGTTYSVKLRVRGIWEPTKIQGGERPYDKVPFTVGGMLPPGTGSSDAVAYQQYSIKVSEPKQTYWLNDHGYLAHDIHKQDYQATLQIAGGSSVTITMNDGNEREIANWTKDFFEGVPPYDTKPSLGQSLRLDVVSVTTGSAP